MSTSSFNRIVPGKLVALLTREISIFMLPTEDVLPRLDMQQTGEAQCQSHGSVSLLVNATKPVGLSIAFLLCVDILRIEFLRRYQLLPSYRDRLRHLDILSSLTSLSCQLDTAI